MSLDTMEQLLDGMSIDELEQWERDTRHVPKENPDRAMVVKYLELKKERLGVLELGEDFNARHTGDNIGEQTKIEAVDNGIDSVELEDPTLRKNGSRPYETIETRPYEKYGSRPYEKYILNDADPTLRKNESFVTSLYDKSFIDESSYTTTLRTNDTFGVGDSRHDVRSDLAAPRKRSSDRDPEFSQGVSEDDSARGKKRRVYRIKPIQNEHVGRRQDHSRFGIDEITIQLWFNAGVENGKALWTGKIEFTKHGDKNNERTRFLDFVPQEQFRRGFKRKFNRRSKSKIGDKPWFAELNQHAKFENAQKNEYGRPPLLISYVRYRKTNDKGYTVDVMYDDETAVLLHMTPNGEVQKLELFYGGYILTFDSFTKPVSNKPNVCDYESKWYKRDYR